MKTKLQAVQNKYVRFCLELSSCSHISATHFQEINWLPVEHRAESCIATIFIVTWSRTTMKCLTLSYINEVFLSSLSRNTTCSQIALDTPLGKTNIGQKSLSFLGPKIRAKHEQF